MSTTTLDPAALLKDAKRHRLVLEATLTPVSGDRFQPAGFPEIGHVIYKAPRPDNKTEEVCVVDSAASMANHLEAVMHDSAQTLSVHPDLDGMPNMECLTDEGWPTIKKVGPHRLVVTSLSEGHRLASSYFTDDRAFLVKNDKATKTNFGTVTARGFGMPGPRQTLASATGRLVERLQNDLRLRSKLTRPRHPVPGYRHQDSAHPHRAPRGFRCRPRRNFGRQVRQARQDDFRPADLHPR